MQDSQSVHGKIIFVMVSNISHFRETNTFLLKPTIGCISIDSFKIRIPVNLVKIISPSLSKWILVNESTGEIAKDYNRKEFCKLENIRYALETQITSNQKPMPFLIILINSKVLKKNYFDGITTDNVKQIYKEIINQQIVEFSFKDFYNSECTDVDFKMDFKNRNLLKSIRSLKKHAKPSTKKGYGFKSFERNNNVGIEFSDRKTTAFKTNPYLKIYDKEIELNNKSLEFSDQHLKEYDYKDLGRIETTVKNKKHFKSLGYNKTTLEYILKASKAKKQLILRKALNAHLEPRVKQMNQDKDIKPVDMIIINTMLLSMQANMSFEVYRENVLTGINCKVSKSRKRKWLNDLYMEHLKGSKMDLDTKEIDQFYIDIGFEQKPII